MPKSRQAPDAKPQYVKESILDGLDEDDMKYVRTLVKVLLECKGFTTPAEAFIKDSLLFMREPGILTPKCARKLLEEFEESFADILDIHRYVAERYPREIGAPIAR